MKKATITISFDEVKLDAIKKFMDKKNTNVDTELTKDLQKLYEKYVPASVREYLGDDDIRSKNPTQKQKVNPPKMDE